jgi:succinyl-diaminopimelate desuccinylase
MESLYREIVGLTEDSIRFRSTADRPEELGACLELHLGYFTGAPVEVDRREYNGDPLAIIKPSGIDRPSVILCGHVDVVPGDDSQFEPLTDGDRLYGRGALDMKGSLAALAAVVKTTLPESIPWWLFIVSDEERGGKNGAAVIAEEGLPGEFFLAAEPSRMTMAIQSKGALRLRITHHGLSAHASAPWNGISSVEKIMETLPKIREIIPDYSSEVWETTASLSLVRGGTVINQVPEECSLSLDIRYIPGDDTEKLTEDFKKALPGYDIEVLDMYLPMICREEAPLLKSLMEAYRRGTGEEPVMGRQHGATDARYFSPGMDSLTFGPEGDGIHGPEEWLSLESLQAFTRTMLEWGRSIKD